jgi:glycosyltransferase involved in cell wall biosynthesis
MAPAYLAGISPYSRGVSRAACALYEKIICVNSEIRDALLALGAHPSRIEVLPAYLKTSASVPLPHALEELCRSHSPVISSVLFHRPEYGFDVLISALERIYPQYPRLGCLVLGGGERFAEAKSQVSESGLDRVVHLLGDVPHDVSIALMARSDAFVRCTLSDGDALSVREALDLDVPAIASDIGYRPSRAILFPPGDPAALASRLRHVLNGATRQMGGSARKQRTEMKTDPAPLLRLYGCSSEPALEVRR